MSTASPRAATPMPPSEREDLLQTAVSSQWPSHHTARVLDPRKAVDFCQKSGYAFERLVFEATYEVMAITLEQEDIESADDFERFIIDELDKLKRLLQQNVTAALRADDETARSVQAYFFNASPTGTTLYWSGNLKADTPPVLKSIPGRIDRKEINLIIR